MQCSHNEATSAYLMMLQCANHETMMPAPHCPSASSSARQPCAAHVEVEEQEEVSAVESDLAATDLVEEQEGVWAPSA